MKRNSLYLPGSFFSLIAAALVTGSGAALAADPGTAVALNQPPSAASMSRPSEGGELILGAAPREEDDEARAIYAPIAEFLSGELGRKVVFRPAGNWGVYQGLMQKGTYDLVFDGPHFTSWRTENSRHNALLKIPGEHMFVVVVKQDNEKIRQLRQVAGRTVCGHAPPNLGTLTVLNEFDNPSRQPIIVNIDGWKNIYAGLLAGKCVAAAIPLKKLEQFEKTGGRQARIIFRGNVLPDNALTAGPRLKPAEQQAVVRALMTPEGEKATSRLREKYAYGRSFVAASNRDFSGLSTYLKNEWGY